MRTSLLLSFIIVSALQTARSQSNSGLKLDTLFLAKCTHPSGCYIMSHPDARATIVAEFKTGDTLVVDRRYLTNDYLNVIFNDSIGFVYHGTLERSAFYKVENRPFPPYDQMNTGESYSSPNTPWDPRSTHTGPRGGKYYFNSKGKKTYIKKN